MTKEILTFDSRDGISKIHAVKWLPDGEPIAVLQIIHGMAEHIDRYEHFAEFMTQNGFIVTGDDHLGHGKTAALNGSPKGYVCKSHSDTVMVRDEHRLKKTIQAQYPELPYFILGHSMGSFIIRNYMYRYGSGISGAIVMGTGMHSRGLMNFGRALATVQGIFTGPKHPSKLINAIAFGGSDDHYPDADNESAWLTRDHDIQVAFNEDPDCGFLFTVNGYKTLFTLIWNLTDEKNVTKMPRELPVLVTSGEDDPVGDYGKAVRQVYDSYVEMGMKDVTLKMYPECRHEILNELNKEEVYEDILNWIKARM